MRTRLIALVVVVVVAGGLAWASIGRSSSGYDIDRIALRDTNLPSRVDKIAATNHSLIAAAECKIFRSTDGGRRWAETKGSGQCPDLNDVVVSGDSVLALGRRYHEVSGSSDSFVLHSDDDGQTWSEATLGPRKLMATVDLHDLAVNGDNVVALGTRLNPADPTDVLPLAFWSADRGETFEMQELGPSRREFRVTSSVITTEAGFAFLASDTGRPLLLTSSEGREWSGPAEIDVKVNEQVAILTSIGSSLYTLDVDGRVVEIASGQVRRRIHVPFPRDERPYGLAASNGRLYADSPVFDDCPGGEHHLMVSDDRGATWTRLAAMGPDCAEHDHAQLLPSDLGLVALVGTSTYGGEFGIENGYGWDVHDSPQLSGVWSDTLTTWKGRLVFLAANKIDAAPDSIVFIRPG